MTPASAAAPSGATVRLAYTVTGRRVLRVALVLGGLLGLLVLGLLFGERAQAVEGVPSRPLEGVQSARSAEPVPVARQSGGAAVAESITAPAATKAAAETEAASEAAVETEAATAAAAEPATKPVTRAAALRYSIEPVVKPEVPRTELPVGKAVDDVTDALRETPPPTRWIPEPQLPGLGDGGVGDGEGPGRDADPAPAPGATPAPMPAPEAASEGGARGDDGSASGPKHRAERSAGPRAESPYATGAWLPGHRVGAHSGSGKAVGEYGAVHTPSPAAPGGRLGNATAVDGNASRHGDQCAAALDSRAPVRLLAGPGRPADCAPIRDRHRDIPEFPG
ncbi:hypothetical protein [Streptomyces sp. KN37]|uniref:hypothetical protein n=1 Tax=Streptomyces sp. KN37 TaxID=3090667 RepID=UPI002A755FE5|nr:hypothetical protein [Streptomyces sp. KN37]WPO71936.1 hypothetical protein R9806_15510 [Streptomyces sp. KN37]